MTKIYQKSLTKTGLYYILTLLEIIDRMFQRPPITRIKILHFVIAYRVELGLAGDTKAFKKALTLSKIQVLDTKVFSN